MAADPRPGPGGGGDRLRHRTPGGGGAGRAARRAGGRAGDPPAGERVLPGDRPYGLRPLPQAGGARLLPLHRPGVPVQRDHLRLRRDPDQVLRRALRPHRLLLRGDRGRQLLRPAAAGQAVRHGRPQGDDLLHLPALGPAALRYGLAVRPGRAERGHADRLLVRGAVLRLGGRFQCLPHGVGDLPDGDAGDVHRVLLRPGHGGRRHQRSAAVRRPHGHGPGR